jgi:hypothetical protein
VPSIVATFPECFREQQVDVFIEEEADCRHQ